MKKRILSLILALSMVLSVLPLGAFAEGSSGDLIIGSDGYPVGSNGGKDSCSGNDWEYSNGALYLNLGAFNLSTTEPVKCEIHSFATITGGTFNGKVYNFGTISGGTFQQDVENHGTIKNGTFNGDVTNDTTGKISGGTFASDKKVENKGTIEKGTFEGKVTNSGTIERGTFTGTVINSGTIENGTFASSVTNYGNIDSKGTFNGTVGNGPGGTISNGTFNGTVTNNVGTISGGTFKETVINSNGEITGGTFAGSVTNMYVIYGGVFNGKTGLDRVTGVHSITWDAASPDAKIEKVNGVSANWAPYVVVTKSTPTTAKEVTITADTEIYSLNGQPIGVGNCNSSYGSDKTTVTFTMPNEDVVLSTGELVMEGGWPVSSNNGNADCKGKGWKYSKIDTSNPKGKLTLTDGTYDFSYTYPQNSNGAGAEPVACAVETQLRVKITGGTFEGEVINNDLGVISGGTFHEKVSNSNGMITGGTFKSSVTSKGYGRIFGGVFNGNATLTNVTGLHSITVASGAKIKEVNGMSADWDPYVVVTENATTNEVIITADTEIFSLNGKSIGDGNCKSSYDGSDYKTVKFTMPGEPVVLNGAITCTDLVMEKGWPEASNEGKISCSGTDWSYDHITKTLTLTSGEYNFSSTEPVQCAIQSSATITGGTFEKKVTNNAGGTISGGTFQDTCSVTNNGTIKNGTFASSVTNDVTGYITGGTFQSTCSVTNTGIIKDGIFTIKVENGGIGEIFGGIFAAGLSRNDGSVTGGIFNGDTGLTDARHVTVTNGSLSQVNGVDPRNADGTTGTAWDLYSYKDTTVTITADTEIFSLNGQPISTGNCNSSYGSDKTTVTFTMPDKDVVLNGAITCTELVMKKGRPEASNEGKISCSGTDWSYDHNTDTLTLTDGTFDFNSTYPQNTSKGSGAEPVKCAIESYATIIGGIFAGSVKNGGTISGGTFTNKVENSGYIENGTFAGNVTNSGAVNGGVFNRNATLINVTGGHNITWDKAYPNAKIKKVNDVSVDWPPYVYAGTTVTITADTDIFSLNGQPIGTGNCNSSYPDENDKTTVTFTMPDKDVVLNEEINYGDLVMKGGYPEASNGGKDPCKGDGWEYIPNDPNFGDMLLLTGSNQTGGLYDFSTIGDGSAVECNVFVGKPTAITGGEFNGKVFNNSGILGGTFNGEVENRAPGTIEKGTFNGAVENSGMIENGAFHDEVKNNGTINDGAFNGKVENNGTINDGTFNGPVDNTASGTIEKGTFNGAVENNGMIENGTFHDAVENNGTINDGAFNGKVENNSAINSGTFNGPVDNTASGTIEKGTFHDAVENKGTINGGVFNGAVTSSGTVSESITGSGTLNGEPITKTPEPEPEPEPTTYTVTVIGGTIDGKTSVSAKENDTLTVVLDQSEVPDGMTFDMWSISSSKLSGDINVDYRAESMTFPMPAEDVTIRAQYRSAEIIEDTAPSPLATAATVAVGGAAAGIMVWQGVNLGVDLYLTSALPKGVPVPTDRRALALLLWETAGKPEVALPTLYGDIPAEEIELQKATRWALQNGLMDAADKKDASFFDPDHSVSKMDVFGAWLRLKKLLGTT